MSIRLSLVAGSLSNDQFDTVARECQNDIASLPGVDIVREAPPVPSPGHRGDPITIGTFALAVVTSGAVTGLFAILKSYLERGIEGSFEGMDSDGKVIKISLKGTSLDQFKNFLESARGLK